MWQNVAFALMGIGVLVLIGWGAEAFFMSGEIPLAVRIAVGVIGVGILIFIGIAIKDRITRAKTENFKEVDK